MTKPAYYQSFPLQLRYFLYPAEYGNENEAIGQQQQSHIYQIATYGIVTP